MSAGLRLPRFEFVDADRRRRSWRDCNIYGKCLLGRCCRRASAGILGRGCNELLREEAQRIQLQDIGEPEYHFLNPRCLQLCQVLTDGSGTADEIAIDAISRAEPV